MSEPKLHILDTARGDRVMPKPGSGSEAYAKTASGADVLIAAADGDRIVIIVATVTETLADGDGGQPTFSIGETGAATKFAATTVFASGTAGDVHVLQGTLSSGKDLIVTAVAGTGTTETGAIAVGAIAVG